MLSVTDEQIKVFDDLSHESLEQLLKTKNIITYVVHNIAILRAISDTPYPVHSLWHHIQNNLFYASILHFTKMFYTNQKGELVHWKKNPLIEDKDNFKIVLLKELKISEDEWNSYISKLKNFRDSFVAHTDTNANIQNKDISHYPTFDLMLNASFFYHGYIMESLKIGDINLQNAYNQTYADTKKLLGA